MARSRSSTRSTEGKAYRSVEDLIEEVSSLKKRVKYLDRIISKLGWLIPADLARSIFGDLPDAVVMSLCGVQVLDLSSVASTKKAKKLVEQLFGDEEMPEDGSPASVIAKSCLALWTGRTFIVPRSLLRISAKLGIDPRELISRSVVVDDAIYRLLKAVICRG